MPFITRPMSDPFAFDLRLAEPSDAMFLARAAIGAGGGIYEHLLSGPLQGLSAETVLAATIAGGEGALSWRNGVVASLDGRPAAATLAYMGASFGLDAAIAAAASRAAQDDLAELFAARPPADSYYLHAIWTDPLARRAGAAALLMDALFAMAADIGASTVSLHVWADNSAAIALYEARGFTVLKRITAPHRPLLPHEGGKLLMTAPL